MEFPTRLVVVGLCVESAFKNSLDPKFFDGGFDKDFVEEIVGEVPLLAFGEGGEEFLGGEAGSEVEEMDDALEVEAAEALPFLDGFFAGAEDLVWKGGRGLALGEDDGEGRAAGFADPELEFIREVGAEAPVEKGDGIPTEAEGHFAILEEVFFLLVGLPDDDGALMHGLRGMVGNRGGGICVEVGEKFVGELLEEVVLEEIHEGRKFQEGKMECLSGWKGLIISREHSSWSGS